MTDAVLSLADRNGDVLVDLTSHVVSFEARARPATSAPFTATFRFEGDATELAALPDSALIVEADGVETGGLIDELIIDDAATPKITVNGRTDVGLLNTVPFPDPTSPDGPQDDYAIYSGEPARIIEQLIDDQLGAGSQRPTFTVVPSGITAGSLFSLKVRFAPTIGVDVEAICLANGFRLVTSRQASGLPTIRVEQVVTHVHNMASPLPGWRLSNTRPEATDWTVGGAGELAARNLGRYHQDPPERFPGRRDKWLERTNLSTFADLQGVAITEAALNPGGWVIEPRQAEDGGVRGGVELIGDIRWGDTVNVGDIFPISHDLLPTDSVGRLTELLVRGGPGVPTRVIPTVGVPSPRGLSKITAGLRAITSRAATEGGR